MKFLQCLWSCSILFTVVNNVSSARILGIFPVPRKSHFILGSNLMMGLAEKGHEIVMITPYPCTNIPNNVSFEEILIKEIASNDNEFSPFVGKVKSLPLIFSVNILKSLGERVSVQTLEHPKVKSLLDSDKTFDAVIIEQFHVEALKVFAWHYKAPLITFSTLGSNSWLNYYVGNPAPPSYIPEINMAVSSEMTFFQRIQNVYIRIIWDFYNHFLLLPAHNKIVHKYFPRAPQLESIIYNTSLILLNSDISTNQPVPRVPNMIDIGGFHVKLSKRLPDDLQGILDNAKHGVIYFSLGSRLRSADLPLSTLNMFLRVFSKLNETVLWKFEEQNLPGKAKNIVIRKWLPQQDVLGHPNMKLFITHGGLLSKIETIYHALPVLTIPVFGDQYLNAEASVAGGYALRVAYNNLTEEYFEECIMNLLNDPKYRESAKKVSKIHHDKLTKPLDTATFWIEYVIHHKGAPHLRVAAVRLNWYQYLLLDVVAFCVIFILLFFSFSIYLSRKIVNGFRKTGKVKTH